MKKLLGLTALSLTFMASAPALAADRNPVDPEISSGKASREFREARTKWVDSGIDDYRMSIRRSCFCASPTLARVTVRAGKVVRLSARPWYGPRTIPGVFKVIGDAIKRKATRLEVDYSDRFGFPKSVSIDYVAMMVDEEIGYGISGFRSLKP